MQEEKIKTSNFIKEIGDVENDPTTTLTSETTAVMENKGSIDQVIGDKQKLTDIDEIFGKLETGDNITYMVTYYIDEESWKDDVIKIVEGMKLSYDNIPIETERDIQTGSDEVELTWEDSDFNYAKSKPNFAVRPPKPVELKAPFVLKKFVTLITDGQSIKLPFKLTVPEGYTGSIRTLVDSQPRPGIWKYALLKRNKGSVVLEELETKKGTN